jgi:hypothetical protein
MPEVTFAVCGDGELGAKLSAGAHALGPSMRLLGRRADVEKVHVQRAYEAIALDRGWWPDFSGMQGPRHPQDAREVAL